MSVTAARADLGGIRYPWETPPEPGQTIQVAPGILWARVSLPMALDHVNVYLLDDGDGWTVIDTGFDSKQSRALWQDLIDGPMAGRPIKRVVVTHHHPDHVGLAGWLQSDFGAELVTTRTSWLFARMLVLDVQERPVQKTVDFWRGAGVDQAEIDARLDQRPFNFADVVAPMPLGFTRIAEGDTLTMAGRRWLVRVGHGHAPEHATFWSLDDDLIIGGDQLLPGISANLGVYATEPLADPVGDWIASCRHLAQYAQERHLVLPGHKLPFTGLPLRLEQMVDNHLGALDRLMAHLDQPRTAMQCFVPIFKREITGPAAGMALVESVAHLNHLLHNGQVRRWRDEHGAWLWQAVG